MPFYPQYAPDFKIKINDQELPRDLRSAITSVTYQDGTQAADRVEVGIANIDLQWLQEHIKGLGFRPFPTKINTPTTKIDPLPPGLFDIDNKLTLKLGYAPDPLEEMFIGEVTGVEASFPNGGVPTMTLVAHDYLHRLSQGRYARGFGPLSDMLVAAILSAENRLIPLIDPNLVAASDALAALNYIFNGTGIKQESESDLELLTRIASQYDADFWVEGDILYLSRFIKEYSPRLTLTWGKNLLDFSPRVSTIGQVAGAGMKFTLREIPLDFLVTAFWDFERETLGMRVIPGAAAAGAKAVAGPDFNIIDQTISSPADIANSALVIVRELRNKLNNRLTGSGSAIGDPRIRAGAVIRIDGLGPNFSGNFRVTSASHSIDSGGYRTSFEARKELIP